MARDNLDRARERLEKANATQHRQSRRETFLIPDTDLDDEAQALQLLDLLSTKGNQHRDLAERVKAMKNILWPGTGQGDPDVQVGVDSIGALATAQPEFAEYLLEALKISMVVDDFCSDQENNIAQVATSFERVKKLVDVEQSRHQEDVTALKVRLADALLSDPDSAAKSVENGGTLGTRRAKALPDPHAVDDGKSPTFDSWLIEIKGKLEEDAHLYPTDLSEVRYIYSRTKGTARGHLTPRMSETSRFRLTTAEEAFKILANALSDPLRRQKKKREYIAHRYYPGRGTSYQEFYSTFLTLVEEAGVLDEDLKDDLYSKLPQTIKTQVAAKAFNPSVGFDDFVQDVQAQAYALEMQLTAESRRNNRGSRNNFSTAGTSTSSGQGATRSGTPAAPTPEGGRSSRTMTPAATKEAGERKRLREEGRCYLCKKSGHVARDCPDKKALISTAIRVVEVEEDQEELSDSSQSEN